jgi:FkbM family methyltransferase
LRDWLLSRYLRGPEHPGKLRVVRGLSRTIIPERGIIADLADIAGIGPGLRLYLHPRDWIEYLLLRGTAYEPLTLGFLRANLEPGDGAILAGVNFGLHVAQAVRAVGPEGIVLGVEPQAAALLRTRMNLELNGLAGSVRLIEAALGRAEQLIPMAWSNPDNAGAASLLDEGPGFVVPMIRLESLKPLLAGRRCRLLLLDVQGYEQEVLMGMDLASGPELAVVELDREFVDRCGRSAEDLAQTLVSAGYELFDVNGNAAAQLLDLPENNLVAVKRGASVRWGRS